MYLLLLLGIPHLNRSVIYTRITVRKAYERACDIIALCQGLTELPPLVDVDPRSGMEESSDCVTHHHEDI